MNRQQVQNRYGENKATRVELLERNAHGQFALGNQIWKTRCVAGPRPVFSDADDLWTACFEYFEWVDANPLYEAKAFAYEGNVTLIKLPKMRAMTIGALCVFLNVAESTWHRWRNSRPDVSEVITRVEAIIRAQKFEGAAAGLLQPQIIARDLGLTEHTEHTGLKGGAFDASTMSDEELAARIAELEVRSSLGE